MTRPLTYGQVRDVVEPKLVAGGFEFVMDPGPATDENLQKVNNDAIVFLTVGAGAGLHLDNLFDRPFITVEVVGPQNDYDGAESLALALDLALLAFEVPFSWGVANDASRSLSVTRTGGRPTLGVKDTADRYHFTCSYITEAVSGL